MFVNGIATAKKTNKMYPIHEFNKYREEDNNLLISHIYQYQTSVSPLFVVPTFPIPIPIPYLLFFTEFIRGFIKDFT